MGKSIVWIKWIGTHRAYDRINVTEVEHGCPVLVEIEMPAKPCFRQDGSQLGPALIERYRFSMSK